MSWPEHELPALALLADCVAGGDSYKGPTGSPTALLGTKLAGAMVCVPQLMISLWCVACVAGFECLQLHILLQSHVQGQAGTHPDAAPHLISTCM